MFLAHWQCRLRVTHIKCMNISRPFLSSFFFWGGGGSHKLASGWELLDGLNCDLCTFQALAHTMNNFLQEQRAAAFSRLILWCIHNHHTSQGCMCYTMKDACSLGVFSLWFWVYLLDLKVSDSLVCTALCKALIWSESEFSRFSAVACGNSSRCEIWGLTKDNCHSGAWWDSCKQFLYHSVCFHHKILIVSKQTPA